jgi:hypothetical protein
MLVATEFPGMPLDFRENRVRRRAVGDPVMRKLLALINLAESGVGVAGVVVVLNAADAVGQFAGGIAVRRVDDARPARAGVGDDVVRAPCPVAVLNPTAWP